VFQDYALFPHLNVLENVAFGLGKLGAEGRRVAAMEMLERVGVGEFAQSFPHTLSGGEQQRVALARALAPKPGLMLMDEPFSDLDVRLRDHVRDETLALLKEQNISTLLVTHDPEEAMRMADRIALMRHGRIVQEGTPAQLYNQPSSAFVAGFFSETNILEGVVKSGLVETPLGPVTANGHSDGAPVAVLIRPEGLSLGGGEGNGIAATVATSRVLGAHSLVTLRLDRNGLELESRIPTSAPPAAGRAVRITLNADKAFVFSREDVHKGVTEDPCQG